MKPEKARRVEDMLIHAATSGALAGKVTEDQFIQMLGQVRIHVDHLSHCDASCSLSVQDLFWSETAFHVGKDAGCRIIHLALPQFKRRAYRPSLERCGCVLAPMVSVKKASTGLLLGVCTTAIALQDEPRTETLGVPADRLRLYGRIIRACPRCVVVIGMYLLPAGELANGEEDEGHHQAEDVLRRPRL